MFVLYLILLISSQFIFSADGFEKISIVGCGYVGLNMAAIFGESGKEIVCFDVVTDKIAALQQGKLPLFEPELADALFTKENIAFTHDLNMTKKSDLYLICVPTPSDEKGRCDRSFLHQAIKDILALGTEKQTTIVVKSTVSPGTMSELRELFPQLSSKNITLIFNPEFMREGSALADIRTKNPVILGADNTKDTELFEAFYRKFMGENTKYLKTNFESAEIIKYAWNSFSASRIAYNNELARVCQLLGGNISDVTQGIALSEELLPTAVLRPGPGYGGSCFPKDTAGFYQMLLPLGFESSMVEQAIRSNDQHKQWVIQQILKLVPNDTQTTPVITLLGLSFKANTDDTRETPAADIIRALLKRNMLIRAYDPQANGNMQKQFPNENHIEYFNDPYKAIEGSDCVVALTEWPQIQSIDLAQAAALCRTKKLFDSRNLYPTQDLKKHGFEFQNMGAL